MKIIVILTLALLSLACTQKAVPEKISLAPAAQPPSASEKTFEQEWRDLTVAARKEGKVVLLLTLGAEARNAISRSFYEKYGVIVDVISGSGGELVQKLRRERTAGLYATDIFIGGATTPLTSLKPVGALDPMRPLLMLPELTDPALIKKTWFGEELPWLDTEKKLHLGLLASASSDMAVNTNLVNADDELKSWKDVLNPKWKGRIVMLDPTIPGNGSKWFAVFGSRILSFDYMRELVNQQPAIMRDRGQIATWLAQGKVAIAIAPHSETITDFARQGAPVKPHRPAGGTHVSSGSGSIVLVNNAPHPGAAKLFINWFLSAEGATLVSKATGNQTARLDIPVDFLTPAYIRQPGVDYFMSDKEEFVVRMPEYYDLARQIFEPLLR